MKAGGICVTIIGLAYGVLIPTAAVRDGQALGRPIVMSIVVVLLHAAFGVYLIRRSRRCEIFL